jgi:hypothetical protein
MSDAFPGILPAGNLDVRVFGLGSDLVGLLADLALDRALREQELGLAVPGFEEGEHVDRPAIPWQVRRSPRAPPQEGAENRQQRVRPGQLADAYDHVSPVSSSRDPSAWGCRGPDRLAGSQTQS